MSFRITRLREKRRNGFSLVELAVVVVIIGVLAAFGVPRLLKSVERTKASEAYGYLAAVRAAQERFQAREGTYAADLDALDVEQSTPAYYEVGSVDVGASGSLEDSWTLTLTRSGAASGYGAYTVTFTEEGYDPDASTIEAKPDINPMGSQGGGGVDPPAL